MTKKKVVKKEEEKPLQVINVEVAQDVKPKEYYSTVKHLANIGDIISVMPACRKYYEVTGRKIQFLQVIDAPGHYYAGAVHPTVDSNGTQVCVNQTMFDMVKPLIESQEYIHSFVPYNGQQVTLNFDVIRGQTDVGMPNLMIQSWIMFAFPDLDYDLSTTWIDLPEIKDHPIKNQVEGKVILNFTERYRNPIMDYFFLQNYAPDLIFAGTEKEHFLFCTRWNLNIPRLEVKDFLEYAYALKYSRFLLCNQSMAWNLATSIGTKRILEVCKFAPNCQPFIGNNSKGYFYQVGCEYYFRKMYNETK